MKKIEVFSTESCPYCKMLKEYLREKKIDFNDVDVGKDQEKAKEMVEKSGQMGVPVIDIDGEIIVGFDKPRIERVLKEKGYLKE
jgi:glutaredoxin-like YruB-family protein